jgi:hypothetical protein
MLILHCVISEKQQDVIIRPCLFHFLVAFDQHELFRLLFEEVSWEIIRKQVFKKSHNFVGLIIDKITALIVQDVLY